MNKKGFLLDGFMLAIGIMLVIVVAFVMFLWMTNTNTIVQANPNIGVDQKAIINNAMGSDMGSAMDTGIVVGFVISIFFLLFSAYKIGTNPVLFIIALFLNAAIMIILPSFESLLVSSVYNNDYVAVLTAFPLTTKMIDNYTIVFVSVISLVFLALYIRPTDVSA